jgi:hypothetical protein
MPQGRCTPLTDKEWESVKEAFNHASKMGLEMEWLQWFAGGLKQGLEPAEAAFEAMLEWDL